ncbi:hypothetical protein A2276_08385 [candidate division WOR-1 bacterium RIFOXYA12_FULL_43_27]|uniref:Uncharacterized protein n=1 Tax=candidate division WOR-1 bacterium RIFOXYC2_FULL_46_14 TaxID=1802587 RepID=A0A1F4U6B9_UNCSA|nr:MAG: hypothetical protein A2276_08385 [candidate division WOR-1 bacterium RIFOXYA12_FULL_43_27]OGC20610.1 MAG: hypothetical protein A2292_06210 [candidate division WOR-1 bacterium RIFOXYB2_FULL_46_45]OGC31653.1 MAG: hypothetical protein A2232_05240 [candidate division WOR-1 bacterium RIFOXYA2_FULL_46_56]OGC40451.1 MAG: hypothetical protein A2438_04240 [candidate division WOR-1 bacterium RIFOXYC2_FULL_46_14]
MSFQHKEAAAGRWQKMPLSEQMANIGSEVERAINWKNKNNKEYSRTAFERALELLDLTLACYKEYSKLKELARLREVLADYFAFDNTYNSTDESLKKYFLAFNYAARLGH